jgi:hypothetical protein
VLSLHPLVVSLGLPQEDSICVEVDQLGIILTHLY